MESALHGIFTLVGFVSEISLVLCAHSFDLRYFTNSCENPVRTRFPWSNLYFPDVMSFNGTIPIYMQMSKILTKKNVQTANEVVAENQNLRSCHIKRCLRKKWKLVSTCLKSWKGAVFDKVFLGICSIWWREEEGKYCARIPFHTRRALIGWEECLHETMYKHGCDVTCFAFRAIIKQAQIWKSFSDQNSTSSLYLPIPSSAETWKIFTNKLWQLFFAILESIFLQNKNWVREQDFVYKTLRLVRLSLLISAITESFAFFLRKVIL